MKENTKTTNNKQNDDELIDVLIAISVIAKRLAKKHQLENERGGELNRENIKSID